MASLASRRPHAVVVPYPAQGHINPCMQLAKQLAFQGYTITFVNTQHNHERIVSSQHQQADQLQEEGLEIHFAHISDGLPQDHNRMSDLSVLSHAIDTHMPSHFEALVARLCSSDDSHPTCIVSDVLMLFTQDIANKFGLPRVAVWCQSAASFAVNVSMPSLIREGYVPFTESKKLRTFIVRICKTIDRAPISGPQPGQVQSYVMICEESYILVISILTLEEGDVWQFLACRRIGWLLCGKVQLANGLRRQN